ncbi:tyrosine-protein phosphatase [Levilactobacillus enshiensis]|uniref:tyrosine-protein phosphatase n=1 Tax=Levilactobacillus enshiensis TaxID=2590213 RepID=UPI00117AB4AC|nr:tyrosine-protein phosphatase [Levilactobacillus enshiensis]
MQLAQEIKLNNGFNCRDLGGYQTPNGLMTKHHRLIRSGYLSDLDSVDQKTLYDYGVRTVIDLRSPREVTTYPDRLGSGIRYLQISVSRKDLTESTANLRSLADQLTDKQAGFQLMMHSYRQLIDGMESQQAYHQFFKSLLNATPGGILFHCSSGKDRTGVLTALTLMILGISDKAIKADYLDSNWASAIRINNRLNGAKLVSDNLAYLQSIFDLSIVRDDYFDQMVAVINDQYGGIKAYCREQLRLNEDDLTKLKELFLEEDADESVRQR